MATLGKIRNRSGLLLTVIGVAMLAFILGDFMSSLGSSRGDSIHVGEVLGEDITQQAFQVKMEEKINGWKLSNQQGVLDETARAGLRSEVWDEFVEELIMNNEFDKLGIDVCDKEWLERIRGLNAHSLVSRIPLFKDPITGIFDTILVIEHLKKLPQDPELAKDWVRFQNYLLKVIKTSKYNSLVLNAMYVTDEEAKLYSNEKSQDITFNYVKIPFSDVAESIVVPTESEIKTYYTKHKANYEQAASKDVDFVLFSVVPTHEDSVKAVRYLEELKAKFTSSKNYNFMLKKYSDNTSARFTFTTKAGLADKNWEELFNAEQGTVIGPYQVSQGVYRIAKLVIAQNRPDSVEARHILIKPTQTMSLDSVNIRIEALKVQVEAGADFGVLAQNNSDDEGSKNKGGEYSWFSEGARVDEFNEACFTSKRGDLSVVTSQYGVHLIEVTKTSKAVPKVKIAFIDRYVAPGNETDQLFLAQANSFAGKILNEGIDFYSLVAEKNLPILNDSEVTSDKQNIKNLPNSREMVKWMNTADEGTLSEVFLFGNSYVVAYLTKEHNKGSIPFEDKKDEIYELLVNEKQAAHITASITGTDLATIAANSGQTVVNAATVSFANSKPPFVEEPELVGSIFGTTVGSVSIPIVGTDAIYVIEVTSKDESKTTVDFTKLKQEIKNGTAAYFIGRNENGGTEKFGAAYKVLSTEADVKDNRSVIY